MEADTTVNLGYDTEKLYKNMVAAGADWLYDLPEWEALGTVSADPTLLAPSFRCPLSKDNYFYAVRSVSAAGNPSLPAVAR